jgi:hypothetical protein
MANRLSEPPPPSSIDFQNLNNNIDMMRHDFVKSYKGLDETTSDLSDNINIQTSKLSNLISELNRTLREGTINLAKSAASGTRDVGGRVANQILPDWRNEAGRMGIVSGGFMGAIVRQAIYDSGIFQNIASSVGSTIKDMGATAWQSVKDIKYNRAIKKESKKQKSYSAAQSFNDIPDFESFTAIDAPRSSKSSKKSNTGIYTSSVYSKSRHYRKSGDVITAVDRLRISNEKLINDTLIPALLESKTTNNAAGTVSKIRNSSVRRRKNYRSGSDKHLQALNSIVLLLDEQYSLLESQRQNVPDMAEYFTDPDVKEGGGFGSVLWDMVKSMTFEGVFEGRYTKDIPKSKNPLLTIVASLGKIYEWQRLYGELQKDQLNKLLQHLTGDNDLRYEVQGRRGAVYEWLTKRKDQFNEALAESDMNGLLKGAIKTVAFFSTFDEEQFKKAKAQYISDRLDATLLGGESKTKQSMFDRFRLSVQDFDELAKKNVDGDSRVRSLEESMSEVMRRMSDNAKIMIERFEELKTKAEERSLTAEGRKKDKLEKAHTRLTDKIGRFKEYILDDDDEQVTEGKKFSFGSPFKNTTFEYLHNIDKTASIISENLTTQLNLVRALKNFFVHDSDEKTGKKVKKVNDWKSTVGEVQSILTTGGDLVKPATDDIVSAVKAKKEKFDNSRLGRFTGSARERLGNLADAARERIRNSESPIVKKLEEIAENTRGTVAKVSDHIAVTVEIEKLKRDERKKKKKSDISAEKQAKKEQEAKQVWDDLKEKAKERKDKTKSGILKVLDFLGRLGVGGTAALTSIVIALIKYPKETLSVLKWSVTSFGNLAKSFYMFQKYSSMLGKAIMHPKMTMKSLLSFFRGISKFVKEISRVFKTLGPKGALAFAGKKASKGIGKGISKITAKKIPGIGLILGVLFGFSRFNKGDIIGGLGEIASGIASSFPGIGTVISLVIDGLLIAKDLKNMKKGKSATSKNPIIQFFSDFFKGFTDFFKGLKKHINKFGAVLKLVTLPMRMMLKVLKTTFKFLWSPIKSIKAGWEKGKDLTGRAISRSKKGYDAAKYAITNPIKAAKKAQEKSKELLSKGKKVMSDNFKIARLCLKHGEEKVLPLVKKGMPANMISQILTSSKGDTHRTAELAAVFNQIKNDPEKVDRYYTLLKRNASIEEIKKQLNVKTVSLKDKIDSVLNRGKYGIGKDALLMSKEKLEKELYEFNKANPNKILWSQAEIDNHRSLQSKINNINQKLESMKTRPVSDWIGQAHAIISKGGEILTPHANDIVSASKTPMARMSRLDLSNANDIVSELKTPMARMSRLDLSRVEQVKSNAIQEQLNDAAATLKTSKILDNTLKSTNESTAKMNAGVFNIVNNSNRSHSQTVGGGGGAEPDKFWKNIDDILGGNVI